MWIVHSQYSFNTDTYFHFFMVCFFSSFSAQNMTLIMAQNVYTWLKSMLIQMLCWLMDLSFFGRLLVLLLVQRQPLTPIMTRIIHSNPKELLASYLSLLNVSLLNEILRPWELKKWSLTIDAPNCWTNSPCQ